MAEKRRSIGAVILAGGKNRRMQGEKKLFFSLGGRSFLDRLKESFKAFDQLYLSVDAAGPYEATGLPLIIDHYPAIGPMGGICSALEDCPEDALFIAACDMPYLQGETVSAMARTYLTHPDEIIVAADGERIHTLLGIYPKSILPEMKKQIERGNYKMRDFLRTQKVHRLQLAENDPSAVNINSVKEYLPYANGIAAFRF